MTASRGACPISLDKEIIIMTMTTRASVSLGIGAALFAVLIVSAAGGALAQNTGSGQAPSTQQRGGPGGGRFGGPGGRGGPMGALGIFGPMLRELNLTEDQQQRLRSIAESHRSDMQAIAERNRPAHEALQQAITSGTVDEGTIRARSAEVAQGDADMAILQARIYSEAIQVLTPDQQTQLKKLQAEMKDHGPGRGRGQRPPQ
jgi:Spy/CpxP family protein refolding chaperone